MNIAIIGAGFTGLTAAYRLTRLGHRVTVFERESQVGGMAYGWKKPGWSWSLETTYHHLFTNDRAIISLCQDLGIAHILRRYAPHTDTFIKGNAYPLDSARGLLAFSPLPFFDRLRTGVMIAACKLVPWYGFLTDKTARDVFLPLGGKNGWNTIWHPLMVGKFGDKADTIAASWLWARIHKRTPSLLYPDGGFATITTALERAIVNAGGKIFTNTAVTGISSSSTGFLVPFTSTSRRAYSSRFDRVLCTVPSPIAVKLAHFPDWYSKKLASVSHIWAQTVVVETAEPIISPTYWLNINDRSFPFLALVSHTSMISPRHYGNRHITYLGNYLPSGHRFLSLSAKQLMKEFLPFIQRINPSVKASSILSSHVWIVPNAQPLHTPGYPHHIASLVSPINGLFVANMDNIFPWDRGTNYAVELGNTIATLCDKSGK